MRFKKREIRFRCRFRGRKKPFSDALQDRGNEVSISFKRKGKVRDANFQGRASGLDVV
jgi:hypothetical protein